MAAAKKGAPEMTFSREHLLVDYDSERIGRREFFKRATALGVSLSAAAAVLAASTRNASAAALATPRVGGILKEGYNRDVSRPDPVNMFWNDASVWPVMHETLITQDAGGKFVPSLAQSWSVSRSGLVWTLRLRKGLKFQSGAPCTAAAVVAAMEMFRNPKTGTNAGFWAPVKTISAVGTDTVKVTMKHPFADFPYVLNNGYSAIFNKKTRDKLGNKYGVTACDGTGPFTLQEFVPGSHTSVKRWEGYPGTVIPFVKNKKKPYLDGIRWEVLLEPATRAQELLAGNVHALLGPAPQDVDRLKKNGKLALIEFQEPAVYILGLNFKRSDLGFNDLRVRKAISHAIDRSAIAKSVFFGKAAPAYTIAHSGWLYYEPKCAQYGKFDPKLAKQMLDSAGWKTGSGGIREKNGKKLSFKIIVEAEKTEQLVAQAIQVMLRNIGIDMQFTALGADYFEKFGAGPVGYMFKIQWANILDASLLFTSSKYPAPACCNASFAKIPALDRAFDDWQRAGSLVQLKAAAKRAQLIAAQQLPVVPIVTPVVTWAHDQKVHNWLPTQSNFYPYYNDVWVEA
jgi:peptide/nickel transport system substrate-binding protein